MKSKCLLTAAILAAILPATAAAQGYAAKAVRMPTVDEAGVKGYEAITYNGLLAPAGTPREAALRLQSEVAGAVAVPAFRSSFLERGVELVASASPEEFTSYVRNDVATSAKLARNAGIKAQ